MCVSDFANPNNVIDLATRYMRVIKGSSPIDLFCVIKSYPSESEDHGHNSLHRGLRTIQFVLKQKFRVSDPDLLALGFKLQIPHLGTCEQWLRDINFVGQGKFELFNAVSLSKG